MRDPILEQNNYIQKLLIKQFHIAKKFFYRRKVNFISYFFSAMVFILAIISWEKNCFMINKVSKLQDTNLHQVYTRFSFKYYST